MPFLVPATLKSISPKASSYPCISVNITDLSPLLIIPMAIPETGDLMGTPPSIRARVLPHTLAMEEEPLDSRTSDTRRIV